MTPLGVMQLIGDLTPLGVTVKLPIASIVLPLNL